ncbi:MAG: aspartate kinase [Firmicutes bacterium]|nr:aspartate kinase [Bacillota bacterium]MCM1401406.1 aspartate kinase [Bacteroides sp.]MCM1477324.1 aspartate kinase [Bacteroides sp.]
MKVLKFGGTSVGTVESLTNVKQIVESCDEQVIVVVSALGGFTDKLIATAKMAEKGDEAYLEEVGQMIKRHADIVEALVPAERQSELNAEIRALFEALQRVYKGIFLLEELSTRSLDKVVSFGERLSSRIVTNIISDAVLFDSLKFIKTIRRFGKHVLNGELTEKLVHETFDTANFKTAIVPGFISTDSNGIITNLGRGGSDYTAAILAASLNAHTLEIWTDVDGFMTADPRIITGTKVIPTLSFIEAMELCNFGAKVIYPPTIYPVFHKNIPIYIKNTFNPSAPGTCVRDIKEKHDFYTKGVSSINDSCLITVNGKMWDAKIGQRVLNTLARNGISVLLVSNALKQAATTFAISGSDAPQATEALEKEFAAELETNSLNIPTVDKELSTIALVAEGMRFLPAVAEQLQQCLVQAGISVLAKTQGTPETSLAFVVPAAERKQALQIVHNEFFS